MSAETIPAELVDILRGEIGAAMDVTEDGTAMSDPNFEPAVEDVVQAVIRVLTDRSTRPAEPAAPVAEAGDGEVALKSLLAAIQLGHAAYDADESSSDLSAFREAYGAHNAIEQLLANLRSTLEAERARADAAEQRAADALARAEKAKRALDVDAAMALIEGALKWANWCAGEGICAVEGEGVIDPDTLLLAYSQSTDDEDWETLHERLPALLRASREAQPATDGGEADV